MTSQSRCRQEGISLDSFAYPGHRGFGKFVAFLDDNGFTIDGRTELSFTKDVAKRYEAHGGQGLTVQDGDRDVDVIRKAIAAAEARNKPTLIRVKAIIGYCTHNKADSHNAHDAPLAPMPGTSAVGR